MVKDADIRVLRIGPGRQVCRNITHDLHQLLLARHDRVADRILLVATQPFLEPALRLRPARRVMIVDVFLVKRVGQGVLRDNDQITPVEIRVPPVFGVHETFPENHIGRHKPPRIRAAKNKGTLRKILEHVVPIVPAKPVVALAAERRVVDAGQERQQRQSVGGIAQRRTHGDQPRQQIARACRTQQSKEQISAAMERKLQCPRVDRGVCLLQ